jgi:hypothetical protein
LIGSEHLCEQVCQIGHAVLFAHAYDFLGHRLTYRMTIDSIMRQDSGIVVFFTTPLSSQYTLAGPSIGTSNIRSLYRNATSISFAAGSATNSLPKLEDSTVFCRFKNHIIGAF